MLELYNEKLLDLLIDMETGTTGEGRYDIKKDKKGMGKTWHGRKTSKMLRRATVRLSRGERRLKGQEGHG